MLSMQRLWISSVNAILHARAVSNARRASPSPWLRMESQRYRIWFFFSVGSLLSRARARYPGRCLSLFVSIAIVSRSETSVCLTARASPRCSLKINNRRHNGADTFEKERLEEKEGAERIRTTARSAWSRDPRAGRVHKSWLETSSEIVWVTPAVSLGAHGIYYISSRFAFARTMRCKDSLSERELGGLNSKHQSHYNTLHFREPRASSRSTGIINKI